MARIEFSDGFATSFAQRIINLNGSSDDFPAPSSSAGILNSCGQYDVSKPSLKLFKGSILTRSQMESNRNTLTSGTPFNLALTNDALVTYTTHNGNNSTSDCFVNTVVGQITTINTTYVPASQSGLATWFCLYSVTNYTSNGLLNNYIIGTVGLTGSGADIEIPDNNLINGQMYRVTGLKLKFKSFWDF